MESAEQKIENQSQLLQHSVFFLAMFQSLLAAWAAEDNWLLKEKHARGCDLNNKLIILPACSCTPVREYTWNGDPAQRESTHKALGAFEKMTMGGSPNNTDSTDLVS